MPFDDDILCNKKYNKNISGVLSAKHGLLFHDNQRCSSSAVYTPKNIFFFITTIFNAQKRV